MKIFTDPKEIFKNVEVGDTISYTDGHPSHNKEIRTGTITYIKGCGICEDGICQKKLFIKGYETNCFRYGRGIHGNTWAIKALIKKEDFLKEEDMEI